jgi:hypothetical protein
MDIFKVPDMPASLLFLILMSSSYVKFNLCVHRLHRFYVSLPLGGVCPGEHLLLRGGDAR